MICGFQGTENFNYPKPVRARSLEYSSGGAEEAGCFPSCTLSASYLDGLVSADRLDPPGWAIDTQLSASRFCEEWVVYEYLQRAVKLECLCHQ